MSGPASVPMALAVGSADAEAVIGGVGVELGEG